MWHFLHPAKLMSIGNDRCKHWLIVHHRGEWYISNLVHEVGGRSLKSWALSRGRIEALWPGCWRWKQIRYFDLKPRTWPACLWSFKWVISSNPCRADSFYFSFLAGFIPLSVFNYWWFHLPSPFLDPSFHFSWRHKNDYLSNLAKFGTNFISFF